MMNETYQTFDYTLLIIIHNYFTNYYCTYYSVDTESPVPTSLVLVYRMLITTYLNTCGNKYTYTLSKMQFENKDYYIKLKVVPKGLNLKSGFDER